MPARRSHRNWERIEVLIVARLPGGRPINQIVVRMKIHEYQAKELLVAAGAIVPRGIVAASPAEAAQAFEEHGRAGGPQGPDSRRRPRQGPLQGLRQRLGGVTFIRSRDECAAVADVMFQFPLVTKQTGPAGQEGVEGLGARGGRHRPRRLRRHGPRSGHRLPVLMACAEGGVEIEEVAARSPEKILKVPVNPDRRPAALPGPPPRL